MEYISGIKIKDILLHNDNWFRFLRQYAHLIRPAITENVAKVIACRTPLLGYHLYSCFDCHCRRKIPHSCKSRFCSSCGKAATDAWIATAIKTLPDVRYQHITFTMPNEFWNLFRTNRYLIGEIPRIAAHIVLDICKKGKNRKHYLPGIFLAIHSYGRDLKYNTHIHLSTTVGGFSFENPKKYINGSTIDHKIIKSMWKYQIIKLFRNHFKSGNLTPYPQVKHHFHNLTTFNKWLDKHYQKTWNVFLQKTQNGAKITANYLGKYLKKPPLAETRIKSYDGDSVSFIFLDHYSKTHQIKTMPVFDFIKAITCHIPDKYFRMIRYFGFPCQSCQNSLSQTLKPKASTWSSVSTFLYHAYHEGFSSQPLKMQLWSILQTDSNLICHQHQRPRS